MTLLMNDLLNPKNLPDPSEEVSLVQTHISMVFIGDEFVYKVKKPVNFGFLDFTTLEKREYFCHQELMLNSRLASFILPGFRNQYAYQPSIEPRASA